MQICECAHEVLIFHRRADCWQPMCGWPPIYACETLCRDHEAAERDHLESCNCEQANRSPARPLSAERCASHHPLRADLIQKSPFAIGGDNYSVQQPSPGRIGRCKYASQF